MPAPSSTLLRDDAALGVFETGRGVPLVFQHGLGGDEAQVAESLPEAPSCRRLTVECRGHGASQAGSVRPFSIAMFAADVLAAADRAGQERFVAGGISMGAAIALHLAVRHPGRVAGLVLVRPAWRFEAGPENMAPFREVARLIRTLGPGEGRGVFAASATAALLAREGPENLASLLGFFERPDAAAFAAVMEDIGADGPGVSQDEAAAIAVPALVVGTALDHIHPLALARALRDAIPGAVFAEVAPKGRDKDRHFAELRAAVGGFLASRFSEPTAPR